MITNPWLLFGFCRKHPTGHDELIRERVGDVYLTLFSGNGNSVFICVWRHEGISLKGILAISLLRFYATTRLSRIKKKFLSYHFFETILPNTWGRGAATKHRGVYECIYISLWRQEMMKIFLFFRRKTKLVILSFTCTPTKASLKQSC